MAVAKTYGTGYGSGTYTPNVSTEFDMIGKVALQLIKEVTAKNPLSVFEQYTVDNGDTIEQAVVKMLQSSAYDPTGANALTPDRTQKFAVSYFKDWDRETYKTTVDKAELRKYLIGQLSDTEVASRLVAQLSESDKNEKFGYLKGLLNYGVTGSVFTDVTYSGGSSNPIDITNGDYKGMLKTIKNTVKAFQFVSSNFNNAGIDQRSEASDIYIVMPYDLKNALDVDELAGVFNLDKAEIKDKIIETDDTSSGHVFVLDRRAVVVATRLFELENQKNAEALVWNYYLHVDRMYALSELFNSAYIPYV